MCKKLRQLFSLCVRALCLELCRLLLPGHLVQEGTLVIIVTHAGTPGGGSMPCCVFVTPPNHPHNDLGPWQGRGQGLFDVHGCGRRCWGRSGCLHSLCALLVPLAR